jgi:hypothetical protein
MRWVTDCTVTSLSSKMTSLVRDTAYSLANPCDHVQDFQTPLKKQFQESVCILTLNSESHTNCDALANAASSGCSLQWSEQGTKAPIWDALLNVACHHIRPGPLAVMQTLGRLCVMTSRQLIRGKSISTHKINIASGHCCGRGLTADLRDLLRLHKRSFACQGTQVMTLSRTGTRTREVHTVPTHASHSCCLLLLLATVCSMASRVTPWTPALVQQTCTPSRASTIETSSGRDS